MISRVAKGELLSWRVVGKRVELGMGYPIKKRQSKKYIGGWKTRYFDEGVKEGVGLEWKPGRSIYYGQFFENKRHGFRVMKQSEG